MNYLSLLESHPEAAPDKNIEKLERLLGASLSKSYRTYLEQSDGGNFRDNIITIPGEGDTVLNYMFSTTGPSYDIFKEYDALRAMDRIPVQALPIADDPGGNLFLLSVEAESYGHVFFWDHERESGEGGARIADFPNMTHLADDFAAFIILLKPDIA